MRRNRTTAQQAALATICAAVVELGSRLSGVAVRSEVTSWRAFEAGGIAKPLELRADLVDVPDVAGTVEPLKIVDPSFGRLISSGDRISRHRPKA